jgi:hypothetical protein
MHPNHLIALAHQHHTDLLAEAERRRFSKTARRSHGHSLRDLTFEARRRRRAAARPGLWGASPPTTDLAT